MKQVSYLSTDQITPKAVQNWFEQQGYQFVPLTDASPQPSEAFQKIEILILFVPFFHNNVYISNENVWKSFLQEHYPDVLLLTAGYIKQAHTNYLDLLQLPEDLPAFLQNAKSTNQFDRFPFSGGLDVEKKLHKFYKGHGDESLTYELGKIARIITMAVDELKQAVPFPEIYKDLLIPNRIIEKWKVLTNRWQNYLPFFKGLPFDTTLQEVHDGFSSIAPFFEGGCEDEHLLIDLNCKEKLHEIKQKLEIIGRQYG